VCGEREIIPRFLPSAKYRIAPLLIMKTVAGACFLWRWGGMEIRNMVKFEVLFYYFFYLF
jgi:hypothetical protein